MQLLLGYSQTDIYVRNNDGNIALTYAKEGSVIQKILIDESHKQAAKIISKNYRLNLSNRFHKPTVESIVPHVCCVLDTP